MQCFTFRTVTDRVEITEKFADLSPEKRYEYGYKAFMRAVEGTAHEEGFGDGVAWEIACKKLEKLDKSSKKKGGYDTLALDSYDEDEKEKPYTIDTDTASYSVSKETLSHFEKWEIDEDLKIAKTDILDIRDDLIIEEGIDLVNLLRVYADCINTEKHDSLIQRLCDTYPVLKDNLMLIIQSGRLKELFSF